jgi:hypothetical protein
VVTTKLYRKLGYRAYFQAVSGYLGRGVRHPPKACMLELIRAEWPEPHGASDHIGFYDASQEDDGRRLLIGREVHEENIVGVQDTAAKPPAEVMAIKITAVVTMDDADAVDCQHGEDEALESAVVQGATTKRSSAVTKEHGSEAAPDKSLLAVDGMVGGSASFSRSCSTKRNSAVTKEHGKSLPAIDGMVHACEADTWSQREDHIHAQGATSSAALSLDMHRGMSVPIGTNTVTDIALSPPAQPYCQSAARKHRASAMTLYVEASSGVVKDSHFVIDLSQVAITPFAPVVNGCTCSGCNYLRAGVIYKIKCYNCVRNFQSTPKCLSFHQDTVSCHESCGASLCPKYHTGGVLLGEHQQCAMCGQHTCHLYMNMMDYVNCWKCYVTICNVTLNNCIVGC